MSENLTIELSQTQRDLVVSGLRYMRNSTKFTITDPTAEYVADRNERLKEITTLLDRLESSPANASEARY